jgi:hypothetical protein
MEGSKKNDFTKIKNASSKKRKDNFKYAGNNSWFYNFGLVFYS